MTMRQVFEYYDHQAQSGPSGYRFCPLCATELRIGDFGDLPRPVCPACGFIQYRNPAPTVSVVILKGERVLLGQRSSEPGRGLWATPSGYIEYGESFLDTARREMRQETGLEIEIQGILNVTSSFISPEFHFFNVYLLAYPAGGELRAGDELDAVAWFSLDGRLPELAYQEDHQMLAILAQGGYATIPIVSDAT